MDVNKACPCLYGDPCDENCTCVIPWSSRGCERCCSYGSQEQREAMAKHLVALHTEVTVPKNFHMRWPCDCGKELRENWKFCPECGAHVVEKDDEEKTSND
jgi:hypothetical protein